MCAVTGVRFPDESADDIQKQKQLLKDASAFLVSCQIDSLVKGLSRPVAQTSPVTSDPSRCPLLQVKDCLDHTALPMDGATLTEALHQRGINVRYLGTVLEVVGKASASGQLDHIYVSDPSLCGFCRMAAMMLNLCLCPPPTQRIGITELITRCAKHVFKTYLQVRNPPPPDAL